MSYTLGVDILHHVLWYPGIFVAKVLRHHSNVTLSVEYVRTCCSVSLRLRRTLEVCLCYICMSICSLLYHHIEIHLMQIKILYILLKILLF